MALVSPTDPLFQVIIRLSGLRFFPLLRLHSWWKTKQTQRHEMPVCSCRGAGPGFGWAAFQPSCSAPSRPPLDAGWLRSERLKPHLIPEDCDQCFRPLFVKHTHACTNMCVHTCLGWHVFSHTGKELSVGEVGMGWGPLKTPASVIGALTSCWVKNTGGTCQKGHPSREDHSHSDKLWCTYS